MDFLKEEPVGGLDHDPSARDEEEAGLNERGQLLHLSVTKRMGGVCGNVGGADRDKGNRRGEQIQGRVRRL